MNPAMTRQPSKENHIEGKENRGKSKREVAHEAPDETKAKGSNVPSGNVPIPTKDWNKTDMHFQNAVAPEMNTEAVHHSENNEAMHSNREEEISEQERAKIDKNNKAAEHLQKYLQSTGISLAFQLIFSEIVQKKIPQEKVFGYASQRLKQIGADIQELKAQKI